MAEAVGAYEFKGDVDICAWCLEPWMLDSRVLSHLSTCFFLQAWFILYITAVWAVTSLHNTTNHF